MSFFVIRYFCIFNSRFLSFLSMFKKYGNKHWKKVFSSTVNKVSATEIIFLRNIEQSIFVENIEKRFFGNIEKRVFCWKYWKKVFRKYWKALVLPSLLSHCRLLGNIWWLKAELFICSVTATTITHHGNTSNTTQATHQTQQVFKQPPYNKQIYLTQIPVQRKFKIHQHQRHKMQKNSYFQNFEGN